MLLTRPNKFTVTNRTIKNNHLFLVDSMYGEIPMDNDSGLGLYNLDTRFLNCYEVHLNNTEPVCLLSSTEAGYMSTLVYTNGQIASENLDGLPTTVLEEMVQLKRESILHGALFERFTLTSYNIEAIKLRVSLRFCADFRDMFEIRHLYPGKDRQLDPPKVEGNALVFSYRENAKTLETRIIFRDFEPQFTDATTLVYETMISPLEKKEFNLEIQTSIKPEQHSFSVANGFEDAKNQIQSFNQLWKEEVTEFKSDNEDFNEMLQRSHKDLRMLLSQTEEGNTFVAAGIPWFVALFGRDSIITARQSLILNPSIAKWTLHILAQYQGKKCDPWRDEEPGKILHEVRRGELARLGEIPHTPYFGSVDATPLWLILLYDYFLWTRDFETLHTLWPNALAALEWIDRNMEKYALKYVTYLTQSERGIIHQGWKDSNNSAMYDNGLQAEPPIALVEVQGYIYLAKRRMATLADIMEDRDLKQKLRRDCQDLKRRFNQDFWLEDLQFYAMGLDSQGRPLKVISSNPGHCLETGIMAVPCARHVASRLMAPDLFSGWGIRTLSSDMVAYNPMSYHNGSIWPHDNAIIAQGMSLVGRQDLSEKIFSGLFEAARLMLYKRLPELFCGFSRDMAKADPPVRYPVACSPQAWAAASVFSLIQSMLNLSPDLQAGTFKIQNPQLPHWMHYLRIKNMHVGQAILDLEFRRTDKMVVVDVIGRQGKLDILVKL